MPLLFLLEKGPFVFLDMDVPDVPPDILMGIWVTPSVTSLVSRLRMLGKGLCTIYPGPRTPTLPPLHQVTAHPLGSP